MKKIIEFVRSENAPIFGLLTMIFGLFQMYAKTYYIINPYPIHYTLDIAISLVVAFGFAIATTTILVHNKQKYTPVMFAFFDFMGYALFFANDIPKWINNAEYAKIGGAFFIALLSAFVIYHFGEIFLTKIKEKFTQEFNVNAELEGLKKENNQLSNDLQKSLHQMQEATKQVSEKDNEASKNNDLVKNLTAQVEKLTEKLNKTSDDLQNSLDKVNEMQAQKDLFFQETTPEQLAQTLKGLKASYTREKAKGNVQNLDKVKEKGEKIALILNLPPIDWDKENVQI